MYWTKLYDPDRAPAHWSEVILPGEYCVFILDAETRTPRDAEGRPFSPGSEAVAICGGLEEAVDLAESIVNRHPELCGQIYDRHGKSDEPLRTVYEPSVRGRYEGRPYARRETLRGLTLMSGGAVLVLIDVRHDLTWMWGYIIGAKLALIGGAFLVRGLIGLYGHRA